jgi:hypothetical protein
MKNQYTQQLEDDLKHFVSTHKVHILECYVATQGFNVEAVFMTLPHLVNDLCSDAYVTDHRTLGAHFVVLSRGLNASLFHAFIEVNTRQNNMNNITNSWLNYMHYFISHELTLATEGYVKPSSCQ